MKKIRKTALWLIACLLLITSAVPAQAAVPEEQLKTTPIGRSDHAFTDHLDLPWPANPYVEADTAFLVELNSGTVLYAKNPHQQMFPASITKIMTALVTIENVPLWEKLTLSKASVTDLVWGGFDSQMRFYEGQSMSIEQALYALSLDSVNTIGYALAEHISGSLDGFSKLMNEKAQAVGTVNTHFNNPHGLNDQTHLTTAHDMAKILWAAAENDIYRKIAGTEKYSFTDSFGKTINCSHGYKVFSRDSQYYDPRCVCGKTGYTSEAMFTRAVYATDGKLDLIAVTMHSDTTALAYQDIKTLLDYGFNNFSLLDLPKYDPKDFIMTAARGRQIELMAGDMIEQYPGRFLVPNYSVNISWTPELTSEEGSLMARYVFGSDILTVTFPVWVDDPYASSQAQEQETAATLPDNSGQSSTDGTETVIPPSTQEGEEAKNGLSTRQVIVICVLVALLSVALYILGEMFLRAKKRRKKHR